MEGCSTRETEKLLSEADPSLSSLTKKEKVRFLGKDKVEIKIVIDEKCHKELEKLKNLLSHRNPKLSYGELILILSKEALKKHDPGEKNTRQRKEEKIQKNPSVKKPEFKSKSVELAVTSAPKSEQIDQCSKEKATSAPKSEQIDHIQPFALGGRSEKENLRLLCAGHNQYRK